jgi:hypothetical protein
VSDHDAQLLIISTDNSKVPIHKFKTVRKINKYTISDFNDKLTCESWDTIFNNIEVSGECSSHISVKSKVNNDVTICISCREYEIQLKEALDELISVRIINRLLQKELLSYVTPKSTWGIDLDSTDNNGDSAVNIECTLVTTKSHMAKLKKRNQIATVKTGQFIKTTNRYTLLTKVLADKEGTIPVIINGDISTEG